MHDLLRDFAIEKLKELHFLHVYDGNIYSTLAPNSRRLASHCRFERFVSFEIHGTLFFFNFENEYSEIAQLEIMYIKLRLLRVLDLKGISFGVSQETRKT